MAAVRPVLAPAPGAASRKTISTAACRPRAARPSAPSPEWELFLPPLRASPRHVPVVGSRTASARGGGVRAGAPCRGSRGAGEGGGWSRVLGTTRVLTLVARGVPRAQVRAGQARRNERSSSGAPKKGFGAPRLESDGGVGEGDGEGEGDGVARVAEESRVPRRTPEEEAFEEKLAAIKKSAEEKKAAKEAQWGNAIIDYDNPEEDTSEIGTFLTKNLGSKASPDDLDVIRLHAEVQFELGNFPASSATYRRALQVTDKFSTAELLQGLTESLVAEGKPQEAVNELLEVRKTSASLADEQPPPNGLDPVQVELLLGKAYLSAGNPEEASAVYDSLISARPKDFRGYLAQGLLLQGQGKSSEAQQILAQARFLAPDAAKGLVEKLTKS